MRKYTTPTTRIRIDCNDPQALLDNCALFFTVARKKANGRFENLFDVSPTQSTIFDGALYLYVSFTQEQTGMFNDNELAYIQLNIITQSGRRTTSDLQAMRLEPTLKAQVIEYETESEGADE